MTKCPSFAVINCGDPVEVHNASVKFTTTTYKSVIRYSCDEFYTMEAGTNGKVHMSQYSTWIARHCTSQSFFFSLSLKLGVYTCAHDGYWRDALGRKILQICSPSKFSLMHMVYQMVYVLIYTTIKSLDKFDSIYFSGSQNLLNQMACA